MLRKAFILPVLLLSLLIPINAGVVASEGRWNIENAFEITSETLSVYSEPNTNSKALFTLYKGMDIDPSESHMVNGRLWFKFGPKNYWVPALEPDGTSHLDIKNSTDSQYIEDYYGILEIQHNYAVKLVKYPEATGRIETYKRTRKGYELSNTYEVSYRKEGEKSKYGDLKTVGGNVVRYMYRTTRSSMNGWNKDREHFGVYKTSFPMPHDGLPHLLEGRISTHQYNKLPTTHKNSRGEYIPHPGSYMGADIVLHTKRKGSRGCLNIENEAMSYFYHQDVVTQLDREIIPLIIYDEDIVAPPIGQLF